MKIDRSPKTDKSQVQGNRQGGGDQRGKSNRPGGEIPPADSENRKLDERARQSRDPKGSAHSATLTAIAKEPIE